MKKILILVLLLLPALAWAGKGAESRRLRHDRSCVVLAPSHRVP